MERSEKKGNRQREINKEFMEISLEEKKREEKRGDRVIEKYGYRLAPNIRTALRDWLWLRLLCHRRYKNGLAPLLLIATDKSDRKKERERERDKIVSNIPNGLRRRLFGQLPSKHVKTRWRANS